MFFYFLPHYSLIDPDVRPVPSIVFGSSFLLTLEHLHPLGARAAATPAACSQCSGCRRRPE